MARKRSLKVIPILHRKRCARYAADSSEDHREVFPPGFVFNWEGHNITKAFSVHDTQAKLL